MSARRTKEPHGELKEPNRAPDGTGQGTPPGRRRGWTFKLAAVAVGLAVLVGIDAAMTWLGAVPPDDPEAFYAASYRKGFWPFVESADGVLTIRKDWVNSGEIFRSSGGEMAGRRFLYPGFRPCRFQRKKPAGTVRIFTFGGSTTFGQFVGPDGSFSAALEDRLARAMPGRAVEVVNLGCPGLESTRVAELVAAAAKLEPDLLIVCSGHNEMLAGEGQGAGGAMAAFRSSLLGHSSIARWVRHAATAWGSGSQYKAMREDAEAIGEGKSLTYDPMMAPAQTRKLPGEGYLARTAAAYGANVRAMIATARAAKVKILFLMPVPSLAWPPYLSAHEEGFDKEPEFEALLKSAKETVLSNETREARAALDAAVKMSPRYAMAWYMRGSLRTTLGDRAGGLADLQRACDTDARTHRMTSPLQAELTAAARQAGVPLVDPRDRFYADLSAEATKKLFIDHCHPTRYGHSLLAEAMLPAVLGELGTGK